MNITDVRVRKVDKEGKMKAVVSITLDQEFVIHDIKVIEGDRGLFIAMPSKRTADGEFRDIAHPINSETRESVQRTILTAYEKAMAEEEDIRIRGDEGDLKAKIYSRFSIGDSIARKPGIYFCAKAYICILSTRFR